jgi:hypothetical protein
MPQAADVKDVDERLQMLLQRSELLFGARDGFAARRRCRGRHSYRCAECDGT